MNIMRVIRSDAPQQYCATSDFSGLADTSVSYGQPAVNDAGQSAAGISARMFNL